MVGLVERRGCSGQWQDEPVYICVEGIKGHLNMKKILICWG